MPRRSELRSSAARVERDVSAASDRTAQTAVVALLLTALHLLLHVALDAGALAPDLLSLALLLAARASPIPLAGAVGLSAGLLKDAAALSGFGANALAGVAAGALGSLSRELVDYSRLFIAAYFLAGKLLIDAVAWAAGGENREPFADALVAAVLGGAYLAVVGAVLAVAMGLGRRPE